MVGKSERGFRVMNIKVVVCYFLNCILIVLYRFYKNCVLVLYIELIDVRRKLCICFSLLLLFFVIFRFVIFCDF